MVSYRGLRWVTVGAFLLSVSARSIRRIRLLVDNFVYKSLKSVKKEIITERREENESFRKLLIWLMNKGGAFVTGERNIFFI